jgi:hypothetical protein
MTLALIHPTKPGHRWDMQQRHPANPAPNMQITQVG